MTATAPPVLIVEDEALVAWDMADTLGERGIKIVGPAHSLYEGLELAREACLCAALLDINLGAELVWPLADRLAAKGVPIAFITADLDHPELSERFAGTMRLNKPVSKTQLIELVSTLTGACDLNPAAKIPA